MLVDSHVNLHHEKFAEDLEAVIERARAAGVGAMLTISDKIASTEAIAAICRGRRNVWRSVGAHPHYAADHLDLTAAELIRLAEPADVVGVGECGLDFHYEFSPRDAQEKIFLEHVAAARETGLPLIIHTREADARMGDILTSEMRQGAFTPLLHCYTGGWALAEQTLALGGYVSMSGIATFKNAEEVRDVARRTPLYRLILETDCPYLAPIPHRGRRCEPAHLVHVASAIAAVKDVSIEELAARTTENFFRLFARARLVEHGQ